MIVSCKRTTSQEKISNMKYMGDIKLFSKNEKDIETLIQEVRM